MPLNRAFSLLEIKAVDEDARIIEGTATTPTPDRMGDIVEPKGAEFQLPIPLLWMHDSHSPIGHVIVAKVTKGSIYIKAKLVKIDELGELKERLDTAWQSIKSGLVRGLSIGFKPLEYSRIDDDGGYGVRFIKWLWLELSAVTIAANGECSIARIKAISNDELVASGRGLIDRVRLISPGAAGHQLKKPKEGNEMKTLAQRIAELEATRAAKVAQLEAISTKASEEGLSLDDAEGEEFDTLTKEIEKIDLDLVRTRKLETLAKTQVVAVAGADAQGAGDARGIPFQRLQVVHQKKLEKGIAFTRYVGALVNARGNRQEAAEFAKRWRESSPEIEQIFRVPSDIIEKAAVNPGTTTDTTWAAPLVQYENMASEFIDYLRPLSIIGRITGFRRVPFKIKVPRQTAGASVNWIGETKVKPLSSLAFDSLTLEHYKIAGIIPLSEELVRFSSPSAETLVRDDLAGAIVQLMDTDFLDPTKALQAGVSPASVTNGVTPRIASGTTADALRADIGALFDSLLVGNQQLGSAVFIMTQAQAAKLGLMRNTLGNPEFPNININGGTLEGIPVVVSQNIAATGGSPTDGYPIVLLLPGEIMLADDGGVNIDMSREASLQMESTPDSPLSASTTLVSLWQHNLVAIKAERFVNWMKRRDNAVGYISNAKYSE